jgi:two-component system, OmpR family, sensor histidine kinase ChvG
MAIITFGTLLSIHRGLRRFAWRARRIRERGPDAGSFAGHAGLPELAEVAAEFDRMVDALHRSAAEIRRTAEDNAHAFKTPIAVIRQSLEPLRRILPEDSRRAQRAIGLVEHSLDRLDGLVASARSLDEAAADLIYEPLAPVDLGGVVARLIQTQSAILASRDVTIILASRDLTITADLVPGLLVLGSEEMIETVLENLIDNAASFSPAGGKILVHLTRKAGFAHLSICDQGPGVPEGQLDRIFERYYSERRAEDTGENYASYFGIGLWIARRNVEAMGGTIAAENLTPHGLAVHIRLPLAPSRGLGEHPRAARWNPG